MMLENFQSSSLTIFQDYIVQGARFQISEELGCGHALAPTGLTLVLISSPYILFPIATLIFYSREQICFIIFYKLIFRRKTDINLHQA